MNSILSDGSYEVNQIHEILFSLKQKSKKSQYQVFLETLYNNMFTSSSATYDIT